MASSNAWANDRIKGENKNALSDQAPPAAAFKAQDTRDFLKKAFASTSAEDVRALRYKVASGPASTKTGGPWASKRTKLYSYETMCSFSLAHE
ncbi:hypothetical protein MMC13_006262 [Lambiella insularis]|nr:hypothetical protein [Lambiella insularis]